MASLSSFKAFPSSIKAGHSWVANCPLGCRLVVIREDHGRVYFTRHAMSSVIGSVACYWSDREIERDVIGTCEVNIRRWLQEM